MSSRINLTSGPTLFNVTQLCRHPLYGIFVSEKLLARWSIAQS